MNLGDPQQDSLLGYTRAEGLETHNRSTTSVLRIFV